MLKKNFNKTIKLQKFLSPIQRCIQDNSSMCFKSITKSGSISKNPKVALCGFKIGRSKLH